MSGTLEDQFFIWFLVQTSKQIDRKEFLGTFTKDITMESLILAQDER
jgi:hypothetical protein